MASFTVEGCELICLPQAFDLFLKHLVGGLHTVYTKLKRLEITPVVCNVEQVRILRGLGAIQPGVNRCKLISRKDFETLYNDCTNARSRARGTVGVGREVSAACGPCPTGPLALPSLSAWLRSLRAPRSSAALCSLSSELAGRSRPF